MAGVRNYNRERERLAGNASAMRTRLEAKRDWIEGERQRNIDLVIKYVISEDDAGFSPDLSGSESPHKPVRNTVNPSADPHDNPDSQTS